MKSIFSVLSACFLVATVACEKPRKMITLPSGTKYLVHKTDSKARPIADNDYIVLHLTLATPKDSVLGSTYQKNKPQMVNVNKQDLTFLYEPLLKCKKGDSVSIWVKAELLVKDKAERAKVIGNYDEVKYTISVIDIKSKEDLEKETSKLNEENNKLVEKQSAADDKILEDYVKKNAPTAEKTPSGMYILKTKKTENKQAQNGDTVRVDYTGKLLSGKEFDSSVGKEPFEFVLGAGNVIKGWDLGIALLKKGEKATLILPSRLGYGMAGAGQSIPPNSVLLFDVELIDIKGKK